MKDRSGGRKETCSAHLEVENTGMSDVQNSRAVLAALKGLQDKIRSLEVSKSYIGYSGIQLFCPTTHCTVVM